MPEQAMTQAAPALTRTVENTRGWVHLAKLLDSRGADPASISKIFSDKRMPWVSSISFSPRPRESHAIYRHFKEKQKISAARAFMKAQKKWLAGAEKRYGVPPALIAAILLVETQLGKVTGDHPVLYRLCRIATVGSPENLEWNLKRLQAQKEEVTAAELAARARYLEDTFAPEILALLDIAKRNKVDIFRIKGSIAGAFGYPQFLPSSFLRFGVDANRDGKVSLFSFPDSIYSVAHFLSHFGWKSDLSPEQQRVVIWHYNKSDAYVDTVLGVAEILAGKK